MAIKEASTVPHEGQSMVLKMRDLESPPAPSGPRLAITEEVEATLRDHIEAIYTHGLSYGIHLGNLIGLNAEERNTLARANMDQIAPTLLRDLLRVVRDLPIRE